MYGREATVFSGEPRETDNLEDTGEIDGRISWWMFRMWGTSQIDLAQSVN